MITGLKTGGCGGVCEGTISVDARCVFVDSEVVDGGGVGTDDDEASGRVSSEVSFVPNGINRFEGENGSGGSEDSDAKTRLILKQTKIPFLKEN